MWPWIIALWRRCPNSDLVFRISILSATLGEQSQSRRINQEKINNSYEALSTTRLKIRMTITKFKAILNQAPYPAQLRVQRFFSVCDDLYSIRTLIRG